ncbi:MAG: Ser/Thr protein phosphatase family protein, UDP-2,3-diacylglucosamine hydrolase (EC homolog [uncultured Sulfurovum sp.]|uniref:Ser/Thr protein phosphatase family protein, UDP-2,3-diacylglucosamine hydrolase n=1 Tax=uncultured Sulfurovum sp. TaxID=269237 RepID=A0A6S6T889_9BACT|nr:MAG: Ser/Thr protein phosphatase family protein, UDP-2,3-diacylglucosamine hydrolase (EC homolog [uncultured Sulfurovum sp.]
MNKYKSIFISDVHLGTKQAQAEKLLQFIKENEAENFYLVGDIIDGWAMKQKIRWKQSHSDVIQKLLRAARKGTNVYYVTGNHDEFLRSFLPLFLGDNLQVVNDIDYEGIDGKKYFVTHGDIFDTMTITKKWLTIFGDIGYDFLLNLNPIINFVRRRFGFKRYWSLSAELKDNLRESLHFIEDYENIATQYAKHTGYDGVICGHIHKVDIKEIEGVSYMNTGDWVESCSALVETFEGEWKIKRY